MSFKNEWDKILEDGSHRLQRILVGELSVVLTSIQEQRQALIARLPEQQYSEYMERMRCIVTRVDTATKEKHERKLRSQCVGRGEMAVVDNEASQNLPQTSQMTPVLFVPQASGLLENRVKPRTEARTMAGLNMVGDLSSREPIVGEQLAEEDMVGGGNEEHHLVEDIQEAKYLGGRETTHTVAGTTEGLNTVVNLSRRELTDGEISLLSKGLKFCLTPSDLDRYSLRKDINDFIRRIRLKEYFFEGDNVEGDFSNVPAFRNKSVWCPERGRELAIEAYAQAVEEEILSSIKNEGATVTSPKFTRCRSHH